MFDTIQWPAVQVLQGMNRHRIFAVTSIAAGVANVALSIALIPHFGLMGVALGTLIPAAIEFSLVILPYAFRVIKVAPGRFVRESIVPAVLPSVPMAFLLYQAYVRIEDWSFMVLLVSGVLAVGLYGLIYLALPGNSLERSIVFESAVFLKDFVLRKSRSG
jgi:O-antigen/teichoic acid export membrane protein